MPVPDRDLNADVNEAIPRRLAGSDMSALHHWLGSLGYSMDELRAIMRMVDRAEADHHRARTVNERANSLLGGGMLMLLIGLLMTWSSVVRAIAQGGGTWVLTWGLMLTGLAGITTGVIMKRRA